MRILLPLGILIAPRAHASDFVHVGVAHEWTVATEPGGPSLGEGVAGSLGYGIRLKILRLVPEVGVAYYYTRDVWVPRVGARLLVGFVVTPGLYAHANAALGGPFGDALPVGFDAGGSLHLSVPFVRAGGYAGIQAFGGASGPDIPDVGFVVGVELALALPTSKAVED